MITFIDKPFTEKPNASVTFNDEITIEGLSERDVDGNIKVTVDIELTPEEGSKVKLVLHSENDGTYEGLISHQEKLGILFIPQNINPGR